MKVLAGANLAVVLLLGAAPTGTGAVPDPRSAAGCASGPVATGDTILGTPCPDRIVAPPGVARVDGGGGDDTILAAPITASSDCPDECHLGVGSQTFEGGPGDDVVYGERGNDKLLGGAGNDRLYGGIGDDQLRGGPGDDRLSGGFGLDSIDGETGADYVRGDGTIDKVLRDTGGGADLDTLSYATGVTPGFSKETYPEFSALPGFPLSSSERGVYIDLDEGVADNGVAQHGGGVDEEIEGASFEKVIGTPFSDFIVGTEGDETVYGGGGADAIFGEGGADALRGGSDGDHLDGGEGADALDGGPGADHCASAASSSSCEPGENSGGVVPRDKTKVSAGLEAPEELGLAQLYLVGGNTADIVKATYAPGAPASVAFELEAGSFDTSPSASGGCGAPSATKLTCTLAAPLDSIVVAGLGGDDKLTATGFPSTASVVIAGGDGSDSLSGGDLSEDVLIDGPDTSGAGDDLLEALGGDDALLNNGGKDKAFGGSGNDLFLSTSVCDDDLLDGGSGDYRDNSSWSKLGEPVEARLDSGVVGRPGGGAPTCTGGSLDHFESIEDLEGTGHGDFFYGNAGNNQLLGRTGPDTYFAFDGADTILANSGDEDLVIDCGGGVDSALIDRPPIVEPAPVGCESVNQAAPESFEPPALPEDEPAASPPLTTSPAVRPDRRSPITRILHRPPATVLVGSRRLRKVVFAFAADEPGASFRCKLDRTPLRPCRSPRSYRLGLGRHAFQVFAIDAAGNRDRSPVQFAFRLRRR